MKVLSDIALLKKAMAKKPKDGDGSESTTTSSDTVAVPRNLPWVQYWYLTFYEWRHPSFLRDCITEFYAMFILSSFISAIALPWGDYDLASQGAVAVGVGLLVATLAWVYQEWGVIMNPAIGLGLALSLKITFVKFIVFTGIECLASISGAGFINWVTPDNYTATLGASMLGPGVTPWQGYAIETWLTCNLMMTVFGARNAAQRLPNPLGMWSFMPGFAITASVFAAYASTGPGMNPARSLGPSVIIGYWDNFWVYVAGPFTGATLATLIYHWGLDLIPDAVYPKCPEPIMYPETISSEKYSTDKVPPGSDFSDMQIYL